MEKTRWRKLIASKNFNLFSANPTKWSNILKQFAGNFGVFDHFAGFVLKVLRIVKGKKQPKVKPQRLRKIKIWTFGSFIHQINSFQEVLKLKQIFQKKSSYWQNSTLCDRSILSPPFYALKLASDRAVLNGNDMFSILAISTEKWYSSFLQKVFVF